MNKPSEQEMRRRSVADRRLCDGRSDPYQTSKNVLEASGTVVEVPLVVSVNTMFV